MKRILVFLAAACVLLSLAACGSSREQRAAVDEAYQRGYNEGYDDGYDSGYENGRERGYDAAREEYESIIAEAADRASHISAMLEEFEYYTVGEIWEVSLDLCEYLNEYW